MTEQNADGSREQEQGEVDARLSEIGWIVGEFLDGCADIVLVPGIEGSLAREGVQSTAASIGVDTRWKGVAVMAQLRRVPTNAGKEADELVVVPYVDRSKASIGQVVAAWDTETVGPVSALAEQMRADIEAIGQTVDKVVQGSP